MLCPVTAWGVDLLCGRGLGAVLLQLYDGETGKNSDRKLCCLYRLIICEWRQYLSSVIYHRRYHTVATMCELILWLSQLLCDTTTDRLMGNRMCGDLCSSASTGSRERCNWHHSPPTWESDCHIQRGWSPEAMETLNCRPHRDMEDLESHRLHMVTK